MNTNRNTAQLKTYNTAYQPVTIPVRPRLRAIEKAQVVEAYVGTNRKMGFLTPALARRITFMLIGISTINLFISALMAQGIYEMSSLKTQLEETMIRSQIMQDEINKVSSLKVIEAKAKAMGMVQDATFKWISVKG
jgi:hypothetical protein